MKNPKFIPTTKDELKKLGWNGLDIIFISGDTYIDSSYNGIAILGRFLIKNGYRVAIIAQPSIDSDIDIKRLGEPKLFWGVSAGAVDSMVANYTASKKPRKNDDFTPGGINNKRPDRAIIRYTNLIRQYFKKTVPIVIGGIEASLRRIVHYDFWSDNLKKSILLDSKADILIYGMAERAILEVAKSLKEGYSYTDIDGVSYYIHESKLNEVERPFIELESYEDCKLDKYKFESAFLKFYNNQIENKKLIQRADSRIVVINKNSKSLNQKELDEVYGLPYQNSVHPYYQNKGKVKAIDTIDFSITTHRGCYGECNFCSIAMHQGRLVISRSHGSIIEEVKRFTKMPNFKGVIRDVGGPTANMYGYECNKKITTGPCNNKRCLFPKKCNSLNINHKPLINLLKDIRSISKIKRVFIASGIRHDLILNDKKYGYEYIKEIIKNHISGRMKIAPEHCSKNVLDLMGKPGKKLTKQFRELFYKFNKEINKKQYLSYYFIAAHPGCKTSDMKELKEFCSNDLKVQPEQVQIFIPTPSTISTLIYYTGRNPFTKEEVYIEKKLSEKNNQKYILTNYTNNSYKKIKKNNYKQNKNKSKKFNKKSNKSKKSIKKRYR